MPVSELFINLDLQTVIEIVFLGFIGGVLSGFIGTGGAFIMTPGMMNLGVPGVIAVGTNIAHKFGKAIMGSKKHGEMGHVDKKLGFFMLITATIGIRAAVEINQYFARMDLEEGSKFSGDLYISILFVVVLSIISIPMLIDAVRYKQLRTKDSISITEKISKLKIPPMIYFKTADVTLSFWLIAIVGLLTGFLAGSIGVGGFLGVPAMIYLFGIPTAVAAETELFLAMFMGAWGAINYAWLGQVDLRLVLLLYIGSLSGIYIGAYGSKVVKEKIIRLITALIILLCVLSRAVIIPVYLNNLNYMVISEENIEVLTIVSKILLFTSGSVGVGIIFIYLFRAYLKKHNVRQMIKNGH